MKVLSLNGNYGGHEPQVALIADSSILLSGRGPLYEPRETRLLGRPAVAYRVSRLGKAIDARFAGRYIDAVAAAVLVRGERADSGQPCEHWSALSTAFDGALLLGHWQEREVNEPLIAHMVTVANGEHSATARESEATVDITRAVEWLSRHFTLKMGDIIVTDAAPEELAMPIGTRLTGSLDEGAPSLKMNIK